MTTEIGDYKKANELVQKFKFELSKQELKLLNYMIASINSPKYDKEFNSLVFDIGEFYNEIGIERSPSGRDYKQMEDIIYKLYKRDSGWIDITDDERTIIKWIEKPVINKKDKTITLKLDDDLKLYLLDLQNNFFSAKFEYTKKMTSKYSIRLYELLKSWEKVKNGQKEFELDKLKIHIDATSDSLSNFAEFKRTVLDKAIPEINEITDMTVSYEVSGRFRRKVTKILFKFKKKNENVIDAEYKETENTPFDDLCDYIGIKTKKDKTILEESINIYVEAFAGGENETFKNAYIKKKMVDIKLADNIKTTKHAYLLGIIHNDIKSIAANGKAIKRPLPDWYTETDEEKEKKEMDDFEKASLLKRTYKIQKDVNQQEQMKETAERYYDLTGKDIEADIIEELVSMIIFCEEIENEEGLAAAKEEYRKFVGEDYE